jgi:hypothetical protein
LAVLLEKVDGRIDQVLEVGAGIDEAKKADGEFAFLLPALALWGGWEDAGRDGSVTGPLWGTIFFPHKTGPRSRNQNYLLTRKDAQANLIPAWRESRDSRAEQIEC